MENNPLLPVRNRIDEIDRQLLPLFIERMHCSEEVARIKQKEGIPILNPQREAEILEQMRLSNPEYGDYAKELYTKIFALSRERQHRMLDTANAFTKMTAKALHTLPSENLCVACQGVEGAYAHKACEQMFPGQRVSFHATWEDVFAAVKNGEADFGVLPIENSSAGSVTQVYDLLIQNSFTIAKATTVRVSHCLAALCDADQVEEVISHPQALAQCNHYIHTHGYASRQFSNTATAGKFISETKPAHTAAICSETAAKKYGLRILETNIQDAKFNRTRFIAISRDLYLTQDANKISVCFDIPHVAGSLYSVLERFALHDLNMTKIESRPVPNEPFQYHFYLDFSGSIFDPDTMQLISSLWDELPNFTFFGNYLES